MKTKNLSAQHRLKKKTISKKQKKKTKLYVNRAHLK